MKAITVHQPWATLVAIGGKRIETRHWATSYGGPIAIHVAASVPAYAVEITAESKLIQDALHHAGYRPKAGETFKDRREYWQSVLNSLPLGCILAVADLTDCLPTGNGFEIPRWLQDLDDMELAAGNYEPRRFGWRLSDVQRLVVPVKTRGYQRIWNWDGDPGELVPAGKALVK